MSDEFEKHLEEEPDPQLDPERSPGLHADIEALEDIEVGREDVTIGEATPAELAAADTEPVEGDDPSSLPGREGHRAVWTDGANTPLVGLLRPLLERAVRGEAQTTGEPSPV